jgi:hypothetical protein
VVERRSERIAAAFRAAGAEARASADITADLWRKLAFISTMAGRALGVELTGDDEARILGFVDSLAPGLKPSFLLDMESGGTADFVSALSGRRRCGRRPGGLTLRNVSLFAALLDEEGR